MGEFKGAFMAKKKKKQKFRLVIKIFLCLIYLLISSSLVFCAFRLYEEDKEIVKWSDVETTDQYSYIEISQMSEAFAVIKEEGKQIHFVIDQETDGTWHTYLIAIKTAEYEKYKNIIDYTYERTTEKPEGLKIYGYPVKITKNIKDLAIKNIENFVPIENKVILTENNFEEYLTDTYLDTTQEKKENVNYIIIILLLMSFVLLVLIIFTIFDKDKIVDEVDYIIEKEIKEKPKKKKRKKKKNKKKEKKQTEELEII